MTHFFNILNRASSARTVDEAHQRNAQIARHLFGKNHLVTNSTIICTAAHSEVIAHQYNRSLIDLSATNDDVRRHNAD